MEQRRKDKDSIKEYNNKLRNYLIDNYAYDGKADINKFVKKVEDEVGNNMHILQHENGDVYEIKNENSMERINEFLPFMKPLNNIGKSISKEVLGKELDFNDIQNKLTNVVGKATKSSGDTVDEINSKKESIAKANDVLNQRRTVAGSGLLDIFTIKKNYNNVSKKTLKQYGDLIIKKIVICRTSFFTPAQALIKKITDYDKLYHLSMICTVNYDGHDKNITIEKQQQVNVKDKVEMNDQSQTINVKSNGHVTINMLLNKTVEQIGNHDFHIYRATSLNCQKFLIDILKSNDLLNDKLQEFIYQNVDHLKDNKIINTVANTLTDLGTRFEQLKGTGKTKKLTKKEILLQLSKLKVAELLHLLNVHKSNDVSH